MCRSRCVALAAGSLLVVSALRAQIWTNRSGPNYGPTWSTGGPHGAPLMLRSQHLLAWDGQTWKVVTDLPANVNLVIGIGYDANRDEVIAIMQDTNNVMQATWRLTGRTWQVVGPPVAAIDRILFDPSSGQLMAISSGPVWNAYVWDGSSWGAVAATLPFAHPMIAADPARACLVALAPSGAGSFANQTWEWHGTSWNQVPTPASPTPRAFGLLAFDPVT